MLFRGRHDLDFLNHHYHGFLREYWSGCNPIFGRGALHGNIGQRDSKSLIWNGIIPNK